MKKLKSFFLLLTLIICSCGNTPTRALSIYKAPNKLSYVVDDALSYEGLIVHDENSLVVSSYQTSMSEGTILKNEGVFTIEILKNGYKSAFFNIFVSPKETEALTIDNVPNKTTYVTGDKLDLSGLEVSVNDVAITDYVCKINNDIVNNETVLNNLGTQKVVVAKEGYVSASFTISVDKKSGDVHPDTNINIYYMNDTHGAFIRQNTEDNYNEIGMSYISSYLKDKKKIVEDNAVIISGGDMFQGSLESNYTRGDIMIDAMNEIGFDLMVVGNHEFDWGETYLKSFNSKLNCPLISCNIFYSDGLTRPDYIEPYTIIYRSNVKIGVIGAAMNGLGSSITGSISSRFSFPDPKQYIKEYSSLLKKDLKCDIVITVMHDGGFDDGEFKYDELTENIPLTTEKYVDAFFFAHDHQRKSGDINDVPYMESACNGRVVGDTVLTLKYDGLDYDVDSYKQYNSYGYNYMTTNDSKIDSLLEKYKNVIPNPDEVLCTFPKSLSKYEFAGIIAKAMYWYVNSNPSLFDNTKVYFSSHNNAGVRTTVEAGDFTYRQLISVCPFDNEICIQKCNQSNIAYMERYNTPSSSLSCYKNGEIKYDKGITNAVSISYLCESESYGPRIQQSFVKYDFITAKEALVLYLKSGASI